MADRGDKLLRRLVAANLRDRRKTLQMSQEAVALEAGFHRTFIGHVERGETNISIDNLERLALALKISAHELLMATPGVAYEKRHHSSP